MTRLCMSVLLLGILIAPGAMAEPKRRPQINLSGSWDSQMVKPPAVLDDKKWKPVKQPGVVRFPTEEPLPTLFLRKKVEVPSSWEGRSVVLHPGKLALGTRVLVNERPAGEIIGYGELDITALIQFGKENTIRLECPALGTGLDSLDQLSRHLSEWARKFNSGGGWGLYVGGVLAKPERFYLESRPTALVVEDVWYRVYVRGGLRLEPQITIKAAAAAQDAVVSVKVYDAAGKTEVFGRDFPFKSLPVGESELTLMLDVPPTVKKWGVAEPNLYLGQVSVTQQGRLLDASSPMLFGFREFWQEGRRVILNGSPVNFVQRIEGFIENPAKTLEIGVNCILGRMFAGEFMRTDYEDILDQCDQAGIMSTMSGIYAGTDSFTMTDPDNVLALRGWLKAHTRYLRNHPSLVAWGYGAGGCGGKEPLLIGKEKNTLWNAVDVNRLHMLHSEFDPSRFTYFHGASQTPSIGSTMIYFNHMPWQEVEDFMQDYAMYGDKPFWAVEYYGTSLPQDYMKSSANAGVRSYVTEYVARLLGDRAYANETDFYADYAANTMPKLKSAWQFDGSMISEDVTGIICEGQKRAMRMWRYYGVGVDLWAFLPKSAASIPLKFIPENERTQALKGPTKIWDEALKTMASECAWIAGPPDEITDKGHQFFSGARVDKSVALIRELNGGANWLIRWEAALRDAKTNLAEASIPLMVGSFSRQCVPFTFTAPDVAKTTDAEIRISVTDKSTGRLIASDTFALRILPKRTPAPLAGMKLSVVDPEGETSAMLRTLGAELEPYAPGKAEQSLLVVGRGALRHKTGAFPFKAEDVARGLRVLVFEQHCLELADMGLENEDRAPRIAFARVQDHPFMKDMDDESLRDWRGRGSLTNDWVWDRRSQNKRIPAGTKRGTVATSVIRTPHLGPFQNVVECEFDMAYSPLVVWPHGRGQITFCQLDVTGRHEQEPAARVFVENLVRACSAPCAEAQDKTAVCLDGRSRSLVESQGFAVEASADSFDPRRHVVALHGSDVKTLTARRAQIEVFVKDGGDLLVLHPEEALLSDPLFKGIQLRKEAMNRAGKTAPKHPLLKGAGPQLIHWREKVEMPVMSSSDASWDVQLQGLLAVKQAGAGRVIMLGANAAVFEGSGVAAPPANPEEKPASPEWRLKNRAFSAINMHRLNSLVMGNMKMRGSDTLAERLISIREPASAPMKPIDAWIYFGLLPVPEKENPLDAFDFTTYTGITDPNKTMRVGDNLLALYTPTDVNNGIGVGGCVDLSKILWSENPADGHCLLVCMEHSARGRPGSISGLTGGRP